jgi:hypothetical protein
VFDNLGDRRPLIHIPIQHLLNEVNAVLRERHERYPQRVIQYLINVVERILLVDDRIQKDPKGPDVLFLAAVGFALKNFGRGIVWICISWLCG